MAADQLCGALQLGASTAGPVFEGRFKGIMIRDEAALDGLTRYLHLNPVRIGGLGLSKDDQRRAKVLGCPERHQGNGVTF